MIPRMCARVSVIFLVLIFVVRSNAQSVVFNFDSLPEDTETSFTDTRSGITATFSSPADPGGFVISPFLFVNLTGNVLLSPGASAQGDIPLLITFNQPLTGVSLDFGTVDIGSNPSQFLFEAYSGGGNGSMVGSNSAFGSIPPNGLLPEGTINFESPSLSFDSLRLSVPQVNDASGIQLSAQYFAVDNIIVSFHQNAVPEPGALSLLIGAVFIGLVMRRRKQPLS